MLPIALVGQGFDELTDDAGEIPLQVSRVLALDDRIREEGEVIADEDPRAEAEGKDLSWLLRKPTVSS